MRRIFITGGLGYIGSHVAVELIEQGYEALIVDNLSNSHIEVLDGIQRITATTPVFQKFDLTKRELTQEFFRKHKFDAIIHFAADKAVGESVQYPLKYYRNNLITLMNLLEFSKEFSIETFIFSSSCTVYGQPDRLPVTEDTPVKPPESPYGNTKQISEEIIQDFVSSYKNLRAISLRYFNPVGAHDSALIGELPLGTPLNLFPIITQTAVGKLEELNIFGNDYNTPDGTCIRDYIHVVDLAKAHIAALDYANTMNQDKRYDVFNVGTGRGNSVLEVINSFEKISGEKLNFVIANRRPGDVEQIYAKTSKANELLNWEAERNIDNMMKTAWNWEKTLAPPEAKSI